MTNIFGILAVKRDFINVIDDETGIENVLQQDQTLLSLIGLLLVLFPKCCDLELLFRSGMRNLDQLVKFFVIFTLLLAVLGVFVDVERVDKVESDQQFNVDFLHHWKNK
jgi:hypothetical protein